MNKTKSETLSREFATVIKKVPRGAKIKTEESLILIKEFVNNNYFAGDSPDDFRVIDFFEYYKDRGYDFSEVSETFIDDNVRLEIESV